MLPYYAQVEKIFKVKFEEAVRKYYPFDEVNRERLKKEIEKIYSIAHKLNAGYRTILLRSFEKYATHVKKANHSVVQDFLIPIPIPGLTDY